MASEKEDRRPLFGDYLWRAIVEGYIVGDECIVGSHFVSIWYRKSCLVQI